MCGERGVHPPLDHVQAIGSKDEWQVYSTPDIPQQSLQLQPVVLVWVPYPRSQEFYPGLNVLSFSC
jgi:hypothetical protein